MANTRTKDLDVQSTRLPELLISVDKASGFTQKKVIRADKLAPLISELTVLSPSNRETGLMKWNDGSGNEYKTSVNDISGINANSFSLESLGLFNSGTLYGYLHLRRFGKLVNGIFVVSTHTIARTTAKNVSNEEIVLSTDYRPAYDINCSSVFHLIFGEFNFLYPNQICIKTDGTIIIYITNAYNESYPERYPNIPISYIMT